MHVLLFTPMLADALGGPYSGICLAALYILALFRR